MSQFNLIGYSNSGANVLNLTCSEKGAMLMPFGVSNERPVSAEAGMLRYNTTENIFEYYNGTNWLAVSQQSPSISSITPQYVQNTISDNSINIIGSNFSINPFVQFISDVNSQVISAQSQTYNSESSITAVISNTMRDLSSLYPFSVKVTNQSSLSNTLGNALFWNEVPTFTTAQSPTVYAEIGEGTGNLTGQLDLSAVDTGGHTLTISSTDLSANTSNALTIESSGAIVGDASGLSAANYNFTAKVTDQNQGFTLGNFTFKVLGLSVITVNTISSNNVETYYVDSNNDNVPTPVINGFTIVAIYDKTSSTQRGINLNGTLSVNYNSNGSEMDYLIVAGGGATGAWYNSGGGGAGGAKTSYNTDQGTSGGGCLYPSKLSFTANTNYTVLVGAGSEGGGLDGIVLDGSNSEFGSISVLGGGHGGQNQVNATSPGNGGCGGGSRGQNSTAIGGLGTACQGYNGGGNIEYTGLFGSGGGGGVGAVGQTSPDNETAGDGGAGLTSYIKGNSNVLYFGGGGGGSTQNSTSTGTYPKLYGLGGKNGGSGGGGSTSAGQTGAYGGGNGNYGGGSTNSPSDGGDGGRGTGGGGGSGSNINGGQAVKRGGNGGCGILIVRIPSYHV